MGKTIFILGAGASYEVDIPVGEGLKAEIAQDLNMHFDFGNQKKGDPIIGDALKAHIRQLGIQGGNSYLRAALLVSKAMPQAPSIDNFIDSHKGNKEIELCGKLAIVRAILRAEGQSKLRLDNFEPNSALAFRELAPTWFNGFWKLIVTNCTVDKLQERLRSVAVVSFNYDRCFEHYIYQALQNYYQLDQAAAASLVKEIEIYHPYGRVGSLPWQNEPDQVHFGAEVTAQQLLQLIAEIKTFTEGTDPARSDVAQIRTLLAAADAVIFLGFAYHRQNLEFLWPVNNDVSTNRVCIGTAMNISHADLDLIRGEVSSMSGTLGGKVQLRPDLACSGLFTEYRRTLGAVSR